MKRYAKRIHQTVIMVSHRMTGAEKFNRVVRMD